MHGEVSEHLDRKLSGAGMLSSIRGGGAVAGAAQLQRVARSRLSGPAPTASTPVISKDMNRGVTVAISHAGLDAARRRTAAPVVGKVLAPGATSDVPQVEPRVLNLPSSDSLPKHGRLSGIELVDKGVKANRKASLLTTIATGKLPLGQWNESRSYSALKHMRPGANIEREGARSRSSDTLSARLSHGLAPLEDSGEHVDSTASEPSP